MVSLIAILLIFVLSSSGSEDTYSNPRQNKDFQSLKHEVPNPTNELVIHFFYDYEGNGFDHDDALRFIERHGLTILEWEEFTGPFLDETGATIAGSVGLFLVETYSLCVEQTANYINRNFYPQTVAVPNHTNQERQYTEADYIFDGLVISTALATTPNDEGWLTRFADCLAEGNEDLYDCIIAAVEICTSTGFNPSACTAGILACGGIACWEIAYCAYSATVDS
jgi:hypothetical protein